MNQYLHFLLALFAISTIVSARETCKTVPGHWKKDCSYEKNGPKCNGDWVEPTKVCFATGQAFPAYVVLTVLYQPPGNQSQVTYGQGSTTGTQVGFQDSFKQGVTVDVTVGTVEGMAGFAAGGIQGASFTMAKQKDKTLSLTSKQDQLAHAKDEVYIWVNPEMNLSEDESKLNHVSITLTSNGAPLIVPVTVAELQDQSLLPPYKRSQLAALKPADFASILKLLPLATGSSPAANPDRFLYQGTLQLDGPDSPSDGTTGSGQDQTVSQTASSVKGWNTATTASVTFSSGIDKLLFNTFSLKVGLTWEWDYQKTTQSNAGTAQSISVNLATNTVGYHDVVDVYFDSLFNSFAYVSQTGSKGVPADSASVVGHIHTALGKSVAGQPVRVTFADGSHRTVYTDAHGLYRVFRASPGLMTASLSGTNITSKAMITPGRQVVCDLAATAPSVFNPTSKVPSMKVKQNEN